MQLIAVLCLALFLPSQVFAHGVKGAALLHHVPWGPIIRGSLNFAATVMDVEGTQRCLRAGTCIEANPMVSTNPRIVWPLEMTITTGATFMDFQSWKAGRKWGWIPPIIGITEHTAGAVTGWTK